MQRRTLPDGACCARCDRTFTSVRQYRFDPLLDNLAICRSECSLLPHLASRQPVVDGRFKVPGGIWTPAGFIAA
jgi:hypothetical protein